jgi:hypothetical protein
MEAEDGMELFVRPSQSLDKAIHPCGAMAALVRAYVPFLCLLCTLVGTTTSSIFEIGCGIYKF